MDLFEFKNLHTGDSIGQVDQGSYLVIIVQKDRENDPEGKKTKITAVRVLEIFSLDEWSGVEAEITRMSDLEIGTKIRCDLTEQEFIVSGLDLEEGENGVATLVRTVRLNARDAAQWQLRVSRTLNLEAK